MTDQSSGLRRSATHTIQVRAPIAQCQRLFTPAGEERWVDGWKPNYVYPAGGRTEVGMVFTTGDHHELTIWCLVDWDTEGHYARYSRVTPGSRLAIVEVRCAFVDDAATDVTVRYTVTALDREAINVLEPFEQERFRTMIDGWQTLIADRLPDLLHADIR